MCIVEDRSSLVLEAIALTHSLGCSHHGRKALLLEAAGQTTLAVGKLGEVSMATQFPSPLLPDQTLMYENGQTILKKNLAISMDLSRKPTTDMPKVLFPSDFESHEVANQD